MKRIITSTLIAVIFVLLSSLRAAGRDIQVSISDSSGKPGDTVTIPVNIGNTTGQGIIAVQMIVDYNPQILSFFMQGVRNDNRLHAFVLKWNVGCIRTKKRDSRIF